MVQWLEVLVPPSEDLVQFPAPTRQFTAVSNTSSRDPIYKQNTQAQKIR